MRLGKQPDPLPGGSAMAGIAAARPQPAGTAAIRPLIAASDLTKQFPGILALDRVSLAIGPGEIVALLGQNGAGKSTLIQILAGVHPAGSYTGVMTLNGAPYRPANVAAAERAGVALVPQEINVVPELSVAENICLNAAPGRFGMIDVAGRLARARDALRDFDLSIDPQARIATLDLASQQLVVIARALAKNARLLILDEPTAALTENESLHLFARLRALRARGVAIVFVSHRLSEVFAISDRIVVMRDGIIRGDYPAKQVTRDEVVTDVIGSIKPAAEHAAAAPRTGPALLAARKLTVFEPGERSRARVLDLDLTVRAGEVVGLFGLLGAGCIEAALAIYGAWRGGVRGEILIDGEVVSVRNPAEAVARGMGLMAQDRRDCLIPDQPVADNIVLASLRALSPNGLRDVVRARRVAADQVAALAIKTQSLDGEVRALSGGNQQKVQIARWLAAGARILILIDPTRGVDVGARSEIKRIWSELTARGVAILIASTDAEELIDVSDRVIVMRHGRAVGELNRASLDETALLRMAVDG
jgi:ABC-type sugar transport system ATPase subunit